MQFTDVLLQYCLTGLSVGSVYAIVAIGFNIIYNTTGVINFAQGEFLIVGALLAFSLNKLLLFIGLPVIMALWLGIVLAVGLTTAIGAALEFSFISWLKNPSVLRLIIITIGLSIVMRESMSYIWGIKPSPLPFFTGTAGTSLKIFGASLIPQDLWIIGICALLMIGLWFFFKYTLLGKAMRACAANKTAASLCGINVKLLITFSFMISAALGALAGCVISPIAKIQYDMGEGFAIKGFTVAILGGLGNSMAAVVGGLLLGLIESFSVSILPMAYRDAVSLSILLFILTIKPGGLFGKKEVSALKEF
jgi:branched-chain amino acid transport system permease protein